MNKSDTGVREMSFRSMKNDLYVQANDNNEDYFDSGSDIVENEVHETKPKSKDHRSNLVDEDVIEIQPANSTPPRLIQVVPLSLDV